MVNIISPPQNLKFNHTEIEIILNTKLKSLVNVESFLHEIWSEGVSTKVGFDIKHLITPLKSLCNCEPVENQYDIKLIIVANQL